MGRGVRRARTGQRGLFAGLTAALLVTVAVGHFVSAGSAPTGSTDAASAPASPSPDGTPPRAADSPAALRSGSASPSPTATPAASPGSAAAAGAPAFFGTLPPGARLPSGAQCAQWVRARPSPEDKGANQAVNRATGQHVGSGFFPAGDTPQACYDGYETWLNNVPHGSPYAADDVWGCVGHTAAAGQYVAKVQQYLSERIWTTPDFQQPG